MTQSAAARAAVQGLGGAEKKASIKRARLRRPMYITQGASYVVDAVILFLYHLAGTTTAFICVGVSNRRCKLDDPYSRAVRKLP